MRFGAFVAAVAALWVQPVGAVTIEGGGTYSGKITSGTASYSRYAPPVEVVTEDLAGRDMDFSFSIFSVMVDPTPPPVYLWFNDISFALANSSHPYIGGGGVNTNPINISDISFEEDNGVLKLIGALGNGFSNDILTINMTGAIVGGTVPSWEGNIQLYDFHGPSDTYYDFAFVLTKGAANFTGLSAVPEPSTWAMMILGLGLTGATLRRGRRPSSSLRREDCNTGRTAPSA